MKTLSIKAARTMPKSMADNLFRLSFDGITKDVLTSDLLVSLCADYFASASPHSDPRVHDRASNKLARALFPSFFDDTLPPDHLVKIHHCSLGEAASAASRLFSIPELAARLGTSPDDALDELLSAQEFFFQITGPCLELPSGRAAAELVASWVAAKCNAPKSTVTH